MPSYLPSQLGTLPPHQYRSTIHLKPELRGSFSNGDFQPEANIEIEATLQPELLSSLTENITTQNRQQPICKT
jgi:hypothetical protein